MPLLGSYSVCIAGRLAEPLEAFSDLLAEQGGW